MIVDRIDNWPAHRALEPFKQAFHFLQDSNNRELPPGQYEISGKSIFAIASSNATRPPTEGKFETHNLHIDIHYLLTGREIIGLAPRGELVEAQPYSIEQDVTFYYPPLRYQELKLEPQMFAVIYPDEAHLPLCFWGDICDVRKLVVKVHTTGRYSEGHRGPIFSPDFLVKVDLA